MNCSYLNIKIKTFKIAKAIYILIKEEFKMLQQTYLGRFVYDVETKPVREDKTVLNNRIAIPITKDKSTFVDVVAWNGTANLIEKHFKKGFEILFTGHLTNRQRKKAAPDNEEIMIDYEDVVLMIDTVHFTSGNPKEFNLDDESVPDFLKSN